LCRSGKVEGNSKHKAITVTVVIVEAWNLCIYLEREEEMAKLSK
jgi:hypothetical protein